MTGIHLHPVVCSHTRQPASEILYLTSLSSSDSPLCQSSETLEVVSVIGLRSAIEPYNPTERLLAVTCLSSSLCHQLAGVGSLSFQIHTHDTHQLQTKLGVQTQILVVTITHGRGTKCRYDTEAKAFILSTGERSASGQASVQRLARLTTCQSQGSSQLGHVATFVLPNGRVDSSTPAAAE